MGSKNIQLCVTSIINGPLCFFIFLAFWIRPYVPARFGSVKIKSPFERAPVRDTFLQDGFSFFPFKQNLISFPFQVPLIFFMLVASFSGLYCSITHLHDYQCQPVSLMNIQQLYS